MEKRSYKSLLLEIDNLRAQLSEVKDTLNAIRTGQIDALVVTDQNGHSLYTLKTADRAYRAFIEQMAQGAVTLDLSGLIIYSNSQFAEMVRVNHSSVLGNKFTEFISVQDIDAFAACFARGWHEEAKLELSIISQDKLIPVLISLSRLQLEDEIALSVIVTDLTAQKKNERELKEKNQQLETLNEALLSSNHDLQQFASVASHDLQEPLRKIQVFSKIIKDRHAHELSDQPLHYLEKILSCSDRMKVLIIDILNYSRLSADDNSIEIIDLRNLISDIVEDFELKIGEKRAVIDIGELPAIEGNRGQLRQAFYNFISNALKFTSHERSPRITVASREINAGELGLSLMDEEKFCRLVITDNGIGFDEQFAVAIFNLFEKLNPKSSFEGSGIGLAIAKKIIDKHHGLIVAKSEIGNGSEFNIILPYKQPVRSR